MKAKENPEFKKFISEQLTGAETGTISEKEPGSAFKAAIDATEGVTEETVEKVSNLVTSFVAAGMDAVGEMALAAMKKDKKLSTVEAGLNMGAFGKVNYGVDREQEVTIPPREAGGEVTKKLQHGTTSVKVSFVAGRNSGLLGQARDRIKADAAEMFGKK